MKEGKEIHVEDFLLCRLVTTIMETKLRTSYSQEPRDDFQVAFVAKHADT